MILDNYITWNFIAFLSCLDVILTYIIVKSVNIPKIEMNGLARFLWSKLGYKYGSIIMGIISLIGVSFLSYYFLFMRYIFIGAYIIVLSMHHYNIVCLIEEGDLYVRKKSIEN